MILTEASNWTQKEFHTRSFVPTTADDVPRTSAMATINRLIHSTTAMLSFRPRSKVALRKTMIGIEITTVSLERV